MKLEKSWSNSKEIKAENLLLAQNKERLTFVPIQKLTQWRNRKDSSSLESIDILLNCQMNKGINRDFPKCFKFIKLKQKHSQYNSFVFYMLVLFYWIINFEGLISSLLLN